MNEEDFLTEEQKVGIERWNDIYNAVEIINECLMKVGERLNNIEKVISETPTPDKIYYKPPGYDDYLSMKQNDDELYKRIGVLEERLDGMQD